MIIMQQIAIHFQAAIQRCLLAVVVVAMLPTLCVAQDGWLYAWRNQPSGEFAADYRKVDPFQPIFSDADLEAQAARKAPSFLTQFTSNVKTSAQQDAAAGPVPNVPPVDALLGDDAADYETELALPFSQQPAEGSSSYGPLDELMPQAETELTITPRQVFSNAPAQCNDCFGWQVLPQGLMYKSYLAGEKEPRMQFVQLYDTRSKQRVWDAVLGGRIGLLRHGNYDSANPQGFQIDIEGAVARATKSDRWRGWVVRCCPRAGIVLQSHDSVADWTGHRTVHFAAAADACAKRGRRTQELHDGRFNGKRTQSPLSVAGVRAATAGWFLWRILWGRDWNSDAQYSQPVASWKHSSCERS